MITLGLHAIICHRIPKPIESLNNKTLIDLLLVRHISLTPLKNIGVSDTSRYTIKPAVQQTDIFPFKISGCEQATSTETAVIIYIFFVIVYTRCFD